MDANLVLQETGAASFLELRKATTGDWMEMDPATPPPRRMGYCFTWIDVDNTFLMFGGLGASSVLGDTWRYSFDSDNWTQLAPPTAPSPRAYADCAYDRDRDVVVLFGGVDIAGNWSPETWEFSPAAGTWTMTTSVGPKDLEWMPLTFDSENGHVIGIGLSAGILMATWAYDAGTDTWENRTPATSPSPRDGHEIAFDPIVNETILFSGGIGMTLFCDFWTYSYTANTWTYVRDCIPNEDPNPRRGHGMVFRDSCYGIVLFGGTDGAGDPPETWCLLSALQDWYLLPYSASPGGRSFVQLAHSPVDDATLVFGGDTSLGLANDTWALAEGYVVDTDAVWTGAPIDAGCGPNYDRIWWNSTSNPPGTVLRFQLATSDNPAGPWTFVGPNGLPGGHYTTPGTPVYAGHDGDRFFRLLAKLRTTNGRVTPHLEDATVVWSCTPDPPYIVSVSPTGAGVPVNASILVDFSEPMNTSTVTWAISGGAVATPSWLYGNRTLRLDPTTSFAECAGYTAAITGGKDAADGLDLLPVGPNPWVFTTECIPPVIVQTDPPDGGLGVPVDGPLNVTFSEPMDTPSVTWAMSGGILFDGSWSATRDRLSLTPRVPFSECTAYTVQILSGQDDAGLSFVPGPVPNPFSFFTTCPNPYIVATDPRDGATMVPRDTAIVVTFSEPMSLPSLSWAIAPTAPPVMAGLSPDGTVLTLTPTAPLDDSATYTVEVLSGQDLDGLPLVPGPVPNPWRFRTNGTNPYVVSTSPADGEGGVPLDGNIVVRFSEPMDPANVTFDFGPQPVGFTRSWNTNPPANSTLTLRPTASLQQCTWFTAEVSGRDLSGLPLIPGPVPNPWTFRTLCIDQWPRNLTVSEAVPNGVRLTWDRVANTTEYRVYAAFSPWSPFPAGWTRIAATPVNEFVAWGHLNDGMPHVYFVRAWDGVGEGPNSTMGVKAPLSFSYSPTQTNIAWISLPYRTEYRRASDIATRLGPFLIDVVAAWDGSSQSSVVYYFSRGQWRGVDFSIEPGDALYLGVRAPFTWVILGTDAEPLLSFPLNPPPMTSVYWFSLPYTGVYARASDITDELGPARVLEVGIWDASRQDMDRWRWDGSGWAGSDFAIPLGAGIYLVVATSFTWAPRLVTPYVP